MEVERTTAKRVQPPLANKPTSRRMAAAFVIAAVSDLVSIGAEIIPPLQIVVDIATAVALWAVWGWRWIMLPALIAEAIPVVAIFPTWTLVVGAYSIYGASWWQRR